MLGSEGILTGAICASRGMEADQVEEASMARSQHSKQVARLRNFLVISYVVLAAPRVCVSAVVVRSRRRSMVSRHHNRSRFMGSRYSDMQSVEEKVSDTFSFRKSWASTRTFTPLCLVAAPLWTVANGW